MEKNLVELADIVATIEPVSTKPIKNIENAALIEYARLEQYQEIKRGFEGSTLKPNFDLWLWVRNLISIPRIDPLFFSPDSDDPINSIVDEMLLEDTDLAQEQTTLVGA